MAIEVSDLKKVSKDPVAKLMSSAGIKLETELELPPIAGVKDYLTALDDKSAKVDILKLLSVALPPREAVWWACLAAEDVINASGKPETAALSAAKAWVYKPDENSRAAVQMAMQNTDHDDETVYCALAAFYADGTAGEDDLKDQPAPPAAVPASVLGQNMVSLDALDVEGDVAFDLLIQRALDIARGGNGKVEMPEPTLEEEDRE